MPLRTTFLAAAGAALLALSASAASAGSDISIADAYARAASPMAKAGGVFMLILNAGDSDDRLIGLRTEAARRAELHTNIETDTGVMQMRQVEAGFEVPAGGQRLLARGGDHLMLMGLTRPFRDGQTITLTLIFERAGEITVEVPVDMQR